MEKKIFLKFNHLKEKYLRGAFGGVGHVSDQIFHAPGTKLIGIIPRSSALSHLHNLCVAWLLPRPRIIILRSAH